MTGFKLTWRIEKPTLMANSGDVGKNNDEISVNHTWLVKMIQLAQYLRVKENMTEEQILDKVMREKVQNISILKEEVICSNDQVKSDNIDRTFPHLVVMVEMDNLEGPFTEKDRFCS